MREDPAFLRYYARVLIREAKARRGTEFSRWLLSCAAHARREAIERSTPEQPDLFARMEKVA